MLGDNYLISQSSAQSVADLAGNFMAKIGDRQVSIPLLVHRRCSEPMFSIANKIAYDNKMVLASQPFKWNARINIAERDTTIPVIITSIRSDVAVYDSHFALIVKAGKLNISISLMITAMQR